MAAYRADGEAEIGELFDIEGDALARAGFKVPDLSRAPEDYSPPTLSTQPGNVWGATGNPLMYTEMNAVAVQEWRQQEAEGTLATGGLYRAIE